MILINNEKQNLLSVFLQKMNVKHTIPFTEKLYNEHPYKYSLYGLSKMLSDYGIENMGIQLKGNDKDITLLELPVIAHVSSDFVIVGRVNSGKVSYICNGKNITVSTEEFNKLWDGVVLVAEPDEQSIEPEYKENKKKESFHVAETISLLVLCFILASVGFISNEIYKNIGLCLSLTLNIIGVYIGYLLVLKQIHIQSNSADKLCSLFKKSDCNDLLQSAAAKFLGVIGSSELGLSYFVTNTITILFFPKLMSYMGLINICALPYTIWSIWYQKFKAKQWCPLCLIVQLFYYG